MDKLTQGQNFTDTAGRTGVVNFDTQTGKQLPIGQTTTNPNVITPASLQTQPQIQVPTPVPVMATPTQTNNVADTFLKTLDLTEAEQSAQKGQESLVNKMLENLNMLSGEQQFRSDLIQQSNVGQLRTELQGINSQILKKQAEIAQDDIQLVANMRAEERRDTLLPFAQMGQAKLAGDAAIMRGLKTAEVGVLNALAMGKQGDIALAKDLINEAVDAKYAPIRQQNEIAKLQLEAIQPFLSSAEKKQANAQTFKLNQAMKEIDRVSTFQSKILENAISMNAPQNVISKISQANSIEDITRAGQGYLRSKAEILEDRLKQAQLNKIYSDMQGSGVSINNIPPEQAKVLANNDPVAYFSEVIKQNKVKGSATLESLLGVIGAAKDLADYGIEKGGFKGAAPIKLTPGVFKGEQQLTTQGNINAINLKVQQWASGASLTEQQTKQVKRFTPDKNDTDKQIRTKLNNLTNFMMEQGRASLANQGVSIETPKIDLFDKTDAIPTTETDYVEQLLTSQAGSPFNVFE
jgi:hypothetical protein